MDNNTTATAVLQVLQHSKYCVASLEHLTLDAMLYLKYRFVRRSIHVIPFLSSLNS